jgi:heme peroxidase
LLRRIKGVTKALLALGRPGRSPGRAGRLERRPGQADHRAEPEHEQPRQPDAHGGTTFVGQFIDHDVTFDTSSTLGTPTEPLTSPNGRTPALDLDSVYGGRPAASPMLYDTANDPAKLLIGFGGLFEDLPRLADGTAIIADPRNDENLIIAGLHCALILFHNRAVDHARADGATTWQDAFARARRLTTWHYHWLVLHEFLPLFVGQEMVDDVLAHGRRFVTVGLGEAFTTSATDRSSTTSGSTRTSRHRCSRCRSERSRATTSRPCRRSGIFSAS